MPQAKCEAYVSYIKLHAAMTKSKNSSNVHFIMFIFHVPFVIHSTFHLYDCVQHVSFVTFSFTNCS